MLRILQSSGWWGLTRTKPGGWMVEEAWLVMILSFYSIWMICNFGEGYTFSCLNLVGSKECTPAF